MVRCSHRNERRRTRKMDGTIDGTLLDKRQRLHKAVSDCDMEKIRLINYLLSDVLLSQSLVKWGLAISETSPRN